MKNDFINGNHVASLLKRSSEKICILTAIETLCSVNCLELGQLWNRVATEKQVRVSVGQLSELLSNADQIITLNVRSLDEYACEILIDDGELILNTFPT
jgi:hypothetical protein